MITSWTIDLAAQCLDWFPSNVQPNTLKGFPTISKKGADIESDHDLVLLTGWRRSKSPRPPRLKFNLDRLKDPIILESFHATIGGKLFSLLTKMLKKWPPNSTQWWQKQQMKFWGNTARRNSLGSQVRSLKLCDKRRELKKNSWSRSIQRYQQEDKKRNEECQRRLDTKTVRSK